MAETVMACVAAGVAVALFYLVWRAIRIKPDAVFFADTVIESRGDAAYPVYTGPFAYFRQHYHGDFSLGWSYWVNLTALQLATIFAASLVVPSVSRTFSARYGSMAFLAISGAGLLLWVWAIVGTWASAGKHAGRGGRQGWATLAKFIIVLGILRSLGELVQLGPQFSDHVQVAFGWQPGSPTKLEVRADGKSILLSGGINEGSAELLRSALAKAPKVSVVVFASEGGCIREGE